MISFREYLIENLNSTSMVLYHTDDKEALEHFKKFDYKNKHHVHFDDWENGIYCTYTLEDARRNSGRYGNYIYKIMIPGGVKNFFYTSYKAYKQAVNPNAKDGYWVDDVPFIDEQIKRFGLNKQELIKNNIYPFAIGLFVALCWCNQNVFLTSAVFCLAGYLASFSLSKGLRSMATRLCLQPLNRVRRSVLPPTHNILAIRSVSWSMMCLLRCNSWLATIVSIYPYPL